jgi:hypothetical protein
VTRGNSIIDGFDIIDLLRCPNCDALFEAASSFEFVRPANARRSAARSELRSNPNRLYFHETSDHTPVSKLSELLHQVLTLA